jgi:hypothetical protein
MRFFENLRAIVNRRPLRKNPTSGIENPYFTEPLFSLILLVLFFNVGVHKFYYRTVQYAQ